MQALHQDLPQTPRRLAPRRLVVPAADHRLPHGVLDGQDRRAGPGVAQEPVAREAGGGLREELVLQPAGVLAGRMTQRGAVEHQVPHEARVRREHLVLLRCAAVEALVRVVDREPVRRGAGQERPDHLVAAADLLEVGLGRVVRGAVGAEPGVDRNDHTPLGDVGPDLPELLGTVVGEHREHRGVERPHARDAEVPVALERQRVAVGVGVLPAAGTARPGAVLVPHRHARVRARRVVAVDGRAEQVVEALDAVVDDHQPDRLGRAGGEVDRGAGLPCRGVHGDGRVRAVGRHRHGDQHRVELPVQERDPHVVARSGLRCGRPRGRTRRHRPDPHRRPRVLPVAQDRGQEVDADVVHPAAAAVHQRPVPQLGLALPAVGQADGPHVGGGEPGRRGAQRERGLRRALHHRRGGPHRVLHERVAAQAADGQPVERLVVPGVEHRPVQVDAVPPLVEHLGFAAQQRAAAHLAGHRAAVEHLDAAAVVRAVPARAARLRRVGAHLDLDACGLAPPAHHADGQHEVDEAGVALVRHHPRQGVGLGVPAGQHHVPREAHKATRRLERAGRRRAPRERGRSVLHIVCHGDLPCRRGFDSVPVRVQGVNPPDPRGHGW